MSDPGHSWTAGIAIVEDEKDLVDIYIKLFKRRGLPVCFVAYDGLTAITQFVKCTPKPHIILMDYRLPGKNGLEVTEEIMAIDPDAKVIFISADITVKARSLEIGACAFIKKPASLKAITDAIDQVLQAYPDDQN